MTARHPEVSEKHPHRPLTGLYGLVAGLSMAVGHQEIPVLVADAAAVAPGDSVVDVGCGPGNAVRLAVRRGATATGVDPSPEMLRLARRFTKDAGATYVEGTAGALPVPDASATVVWAIASAHHWPDTGAGLREMARVLAPGGRLVVAERLVAPGARGHAAHGLTSEGAAALARAAEAAGLTGAAVTRRSAGRRTLALVTATAPG